MFKVFAERMGLETGWNCHISLSDYGGLPEGTSSATSSERIGGSIGEFTAGDEQTDQGTQQDNEDISPRHVSWVDAKEETPRRSKEMGMTVLRTLFTCNIEIWQS